MYQISNTAFYQKVWIQLLQNLIELILSGFDSSSQDKYGTKNITSKTFNPKFKTKQKNIANSKNQHCNILLYSFKVTK